MLRCDFRLPRITMYTIMYHDILNYMPPRTLIHITMCTSMYHHWHYVRYHDCHHYHHYHHYCHYPSHTPDITIHYCPSQCRQILSDIGVLPPPHVRRKQQSRPLFPALRFGSRSREPTTTPRGHIDLEVAGVGWTPQGKARVRGACRLDGDAHSLSYVEYFES